MAESCARKVRKDYVRLLSDAQARVILNNAVATGVPLFNQGDWVGCYTIYRGAILSVQTLLGDRPNLEAALANALQQANAQPSFADKAWTLRRGIDLALEELRPPS
jgi:hypothetical protein